MAFTVIFLCTIIVMMLDSSVSLVSNIHGFSSIVSLVQAQDIAISSVEQSTIVSDTTRTGAVTISGELCDYCSFQLGPNVILSSSPSLNFQVTMGKGSNITIVGVRFDVTPSASSSSASDFAAVSFRLKFKSQSVCGLPTPQKLSDRPSIFVNNSTIIGQSQRSARALSLDELVLSDPDEVSCTTATSISALTNLPHLFLAVNNSNLLSYCTGTSCTSFTATSTIGSSTNARAVGKFVTLLDLEVSNSYLESQILDSSTSGFARNIEIYEFGFSSLLLKHNQLSAFANESTSSWRMTENIAILSPNRRFSGSTADLETKYSVFYKYECDVLLAFNHFRVRSHTNPSQIMEVDLRYFSRFWLLHSTAEHIMTAAPSSKDSLFLYLVRILQLGYETNKTKEQLGWNNPKMMNEYFPPSGVDDDSSFNSSAENGSNNNNNNNNNNSSSSSTRNNQRTINDGSSSSSSSDNNDDHRNNNNNKEPSTLTYDRLGGLIVYEWRSYQDVYETPYLFIMEQMHWSRNQTFFNLNTYNKRGEISEFSASVTSILWEKIWSAEVVFVKNLYSVYHDMKEHSLARCESDPLYAKFFIVRNATMVRQTSPDYEHKQQTNTLVFTNSWRETVIDIDGVYHLLAEGNDAKKVEKSIGNSLFSLHGAKSCTARNYFSAGLATDPSSGPMFALLEGTRFEGDVFIENVQSYTSSVGLISTGIGFITAKPSQTGYGIGIPEGNFGSIPLSSYRNVTIRNATIDIYRNLGPGQNPFRNAAFGFAQVRIDSLTVIESHIAAKTNLFGCIVGATGSVTKLTFARPCSVLGMAPDGVSFKSSTEVADVVKESASKTGFTTVPSMIVVERCTETKSFKFPLPTETVSVTPEVSPTISLVPTSTFTRPRTLTASFHPPPISSQLSAPVKSAIGATSSLATLGSLVGGNPAVALDANRAVSSLVTLSRCTSYKQAQNTKTVKTEEEVRKEFIEDYINRPLSFPESPIPFLCMGQERGSCLRGAAFANWLILILVAVGATGFGLFKWSQIQRAKMKKNDEADLNEIDNNDIFVEDAQNSKRRRRSSLPFAASASSITTPPTFVSSDDYNRGDDEEEEMTLLPPAALASKNENNRHTTSNSKEVPLLISDRRQSSLTNNNSGTRRKSATISSSSILSQSSTSLMSRSRKSQTPFISPALTFTSNSNSSGSKKLFSSSKSPSPTNNNKKFETADNSNSSRLSPLDQHRHQRAKSLERELSFSTLESLRKDREQRHRQQQIDNALLFHQKQQRFYSFSRFPMFLGQATAVLLSPWSQITASLIVAPDLPSADMLVWGVGSMLVWAVFSFIFVKTVYQHLQTLDEVDEMIKNEKKKSNKQKNNNRKNNNNKKKQQRGRSHQNRNNRNGEEADDDDNEFSNFTELQQIQERAPWRLEQSFLNYGEGNMSEWRRAIGRFLRSKFGRWLFIGSEVWAEGARAGGRANGRIGSLLWQYGSVVDKYRGSYQVQVPIDDRTIPKGKQSLSQSTHEKFNNEINSRVYRYDDILTRLCPFAFAVNALLTAFTGFVTGLAAVNPETCDGVLISQTTVSAICLTVTVLLRPYIVPSRNALAILGDVLLFLGCVISQSSDYSPDNTAGPALVICSIVITVLSGAISGGKKVLLFLCGGALYLRSELWRKVSQGLDRLFQGIGIFLADAAGV